MFCQNKFTQKKLLSEWVRKITQPLHNKTSQESRKAALRVGRLSRCWDDKTNCDKTQKLKLWKKNLKTQIVTKLINSNCDKTRGLIRPAILQNPGMDTFLRAEPRFVHLSCNILILMKNTAMQGPNYELCSQVGVIQKFSGFFLRF